MRVLVFVLCFLLASTAYGYSTRNVKLPAATVGASADATPISSLININKHQAFDSLLVTIEVSAVSETNGITYYLQESYDGVKFFDVGSQSQAAQASFDIDSSSDVANATETFTETGHGLQQGEPIYVEEGTTLPDGLSETVYYAIVTGANTFKLASSYANAIAGTAVAIADDGTGTHNFYKAKTEIYMSRTDSSDAAQMPLWPVIRVVADSGASDSATVSKIYVSGFEN